MVPECRLPNDMSWCSVHNVNLNDGKTPHSSIHIAAIAPFKNNSPYQNHENIIPTCIQIYAFNNTEGDRVKLAAMIPVDSKSNTNPNSNYNVEWWPKTVRADGSLNFLDFILCVILCASISSC